jgi:predicted nucleic acid-binding protein
VTTVVDASVALRWCFQLNGSDRAEELLRSNDHLIAPDLVIAEITNAAWKLVIFDGVITESAQAAVRDVAKAFEDLVPTSVLKDRALAIAVELRHPAYDCFYLALAERSASPLVSADDRLIRRCANTPFAQLIRSL